MPMNIIGIEQRTQARRHRLQVMLEMITENSPMKLTEILIGLGEIAGSRNTLTDDIAILIRQQKIITLERKRYPMLVCRADFPLGGYEQYAVMGSVAQKPVAVPRPAMSAVRPGRPAAKKPEPGAGVKITELGPGHRLVTFGDNYRSGHGQRAATGAQKNSSIVSIYV